MRSHNLIGLLGVTIQWSCAMQTSVPLPSPAATATVGSPTPAERLARYTTVRLEADQSKLTARERQMLPLLIDAAREMNSVFWAQSYGSRDELMRMISDPVVCRLADVNYGPWDRLDDNAPFVPGVGPKPPGAQYYPRDMTKAEFEEAVKVGGAGADSLKSLYTLVRRDASRKLVTHPFHQAYSTQHRAAAAKL